MPNTPVWQGMHNSLAGPTDQLQRIESILLKKLHFNSLNEKVFLYFLSERWRKIQFIALNLFQTIEDKRTWDCVKKPFQPIVPLDSAPKDNFLFGFGFIPSSPPLPLAMLWPKKALSFAHFTPNSTLFGVGGEGSLVLGKAELHPREARAWTEPHTKGNVVLYPYEKVW